MAKVRWHTVSEAAALSGYSVSTIKRAVRSGALETVKFGERKLRISDSSLRKWCKSKRLDYYR